MKVLNFANSMLNGQCKKIISKIYSLIQVLSILAYFIIAAYSLYRSKITLNRPGVSKEVRKIFMNK